MPATQDVYDVRALREHPWGGPAWGVAADDPARVRAIWEHMSPLQRRIMTILIERAPTPTDAAALARRADLDGPHTPNSTAAIASVLMGSLRHFQAVGREFPVHCVGRESQSRAFFLDRTTAAVWRSALADLAKPQPRDG